MMFSSHSIFFLSLFNFDDKGGCQNILKIIKRHQSLDQKGCQNIISILFLSMSVCSNKKKMRELEFEMSSVVVVAPPDAGVGV